MKRFTGVVNLYWKGKNYGSTTRQVLARNRSSAIKKLKEKMNFKKDGRSNVVKVTKCMLAKNYK